MSEGRSWSREDTGMFSFKVFLVLGSPFHLLYVLTQRTDSLLSSQRQNALSSLRKVCSLLMSSRSTVESGLKKLSREPC